MIQEKIYEDLDDGRNESKIAWKIRAQRKRQQKHLTLGLTREEFANIQESLKYRPLEGKYLEFYIWEKWWHSNLQHSLKYSTSLQFQLEKLSNNEILSTLWTLVFTFLDSLSFISLNLWNYSRVQY